MYNIISVQLTDFFASYHSYFTQNVLESHNTYNSLKLLKKYNNFFEVILFNTQTQSNIKTLLVFVNKKLLKIKTYLL